MAMANDSPIERLFAQNPTLLANPYPFYRTLNASDPVLHVPSLFGLGGWVVTSHAVCSSVLRGKAFGKEGQRVLPPEVLARIPQEGAELAERRRHSMLFRDPPDHARLRGLVNQAFTPRTIETLHDHIAAIAEQLLDASRDAGAAEGAPAGRMDVVRDFAFPLPVIVIAELLGVPPADRDHFKRWSTALTLGLNPAASTEDLAQTKEALVALDDYLRAVVEERRRAPRADLISGLIRAQQAGDRLSEDELLATCRLLLSAGHETTVNLIGNGTLALLRDPAQRAAVVDDPALLDNGVEEILRYDSPVQLTVRFCLEDTVPLGPHVAKRGEPIFLLLGAANRDPTVFTDPDTFDLRRENAHAQIAFGAGIHYCLGAPLARLEARIALAALFRRFPRLALDAEEPTWRKNFVLRGPERLPVVF